MATLSNKLNVLAWAIEATSDYSSDLVEFIHEELIPNAEEMEKKLGYIK